MNETVASAEAWQGERSDLHGNAASTHTHTHAVTYSNSCEKLGCQEKQGCSSIHETKFSPYNNYVHPQSWPPPRSLSQLHLSIFLYIGYRGVADVLYASCGRDSLRSELTGLDFH